MCDAIAYVYVYTDEPTRFIGVGVNLHVFCSHYDKKCERLFEDSARGW